MRAFKSLIEAEKTTRQHGSFSPGILFDDQDCDGVKEILYQAADLNCYIHERGGSVFELDLLRGKQDLCAVKMPGLPGGGRSFIDSFSAAGGFDDVLLDLSSQVYASNERDKGPQKVGLQRDFVLRQSQGLAQMSLRKSYLFQKHGLSVDVELVNRSNHVVDFRFISELRFQSSTSLEGLVFAAAKGRESLKLPCGSGELGEAVDGLSVSDPQGKELLELRSDRAFHLRVDHILDEVPLADRDDSIPLAGREDRLALYQGTRLRFGWDLVLEPDAQVLCSLSLHLGG